MIKKAFDTQKDNDLFAQNYEHGDLDTEVISNILQPVNDNYPQVKRYCDFWDYSELKIALRGLVEEYAARAMEEKFGPCDFKFTGNREYENYILDYEGLTVVASAKREVILTTDRDFLSKLVAFEQAFCQFVIDVLFLHYHEIMMDDRDTLNRLEKSGIIVNQKIIF